MDINKPLILLDAGHGGIVNGKYTTAGKRSPIWDDGSQYFEGVGNRLIRDELIKLLDDANISYVVVNPSDYDMTLQSRVRKINTICEKSNRNILGISIHSNGSSNEKANGWEAFTYYGNSDSDYFAELLYKEIKKEFHNSKIRTDYSDNDIDKEAQFYILKYTKCPFVLSENFFHTNEKECKEILMTSSGRAKIALAHFKAIKKYFKI